MVSAISFGVLRRDAPSTIAIMRSRKLSPGLLTMRTMIQSDSTRVPPVTELRSPPDSRITGADSPVTADSSTVAAPSMISPSPGMNSPALTMTRSPLRKSLAVRERDRVAALARGNLVRDDVLAGAAQRCGLGLAAAFGDRLGEIREQQREPEPQRNAEDETRRRLAVPAEGLQPQRRRQHAADEHDEHDRVAELRARRELAE